MNLDWAGEDRPRPHPLIVSLALIATVGISLVAGPNAKGLFGALLAAAMVAIASSDLRDHIIPDQLTAGSVLLALLYEGLVAPQAGFQAVSFALLSGIAAAAPLLALMIGYRALRGQDGLGLGDVKLAAVAGVWLNWLTVIIAIDLAALSALAMTILMSKVHRRALTATTILPFGLFLAPAIWVGWLLDCLLF
jgi:leader peptidase (prepilin peptidase)/N-methyltransferase